VSFGILALIVLAGLAGPALTAGRPAIPVVVGELLAGVVVGRSGAGWIDPGQPTIAFLAEIGFAMLMFTAGLHVPLRQPGIRVSAGRGGLAALVAATLAVPAGLLIAALTTGGHAAIYVVLLASGSAAVVGPALDERRLLRRHDALTVLAQVAIADVAAIVAVPLVLQPEDARRAILGSLLVAGCAVGVWRVALLVPSRGRVRSIRRLSKRRSWALDLRLSLLTLFGLAWIAQQSGTSILIAGFGVGLVVAALGGPKRLSRQVTGIAAGFFVPLFFVVLGARMDLRALGLHAELIELGVLLVACNVAVHLIAALITRQAPAAGLLATAQLGVPAAVVSLGLQRDVLAPGVGAAILAAALISLAVCSLGAGRLAAATAHADTPTAEPAQAPVG
jgi:Kef-type K+ transport system membrane component KefB